MNGKQYIPQLLDRLKKINPYLIILFGSYAYGQPHEDSDIDILIVTNDDFVPETRKELLEYRYNISKLVFDIIEKIPVDLLIYTKPMFEKFKQLDSSFSREILTKGKKLYESNNTRVA